MNMHNTIELLKYLYNSDKGYTKSALKHNLNYLNLTSREFDKTIKTLKDNKVVIKDKHKLFYINKEFDYLYGTYVITKNKKFVAGYDLRGNNNQLEISDKYENNAFYKDKVLAIKTSPTEGKIVLIFEHFKTKITGVYMASENYGFVIPDNKNFNKDIYVPKNKSLNALSYDNVEVEIMPHILGKNPEGEITKVYAFNPSKEKQKLTLDSILESYRIERNHSLKAINQVKNLKKESLTDQLYRRTDLTFENIFTIDGEDSKDLDDAISIKKLDNENYLLGVHIADVSHYVPENSKLDKEALDRGTSIYLINQVIPMLPPILSNDLCSLNPNQLRLTLSCEMEIDKNGNVVRSRVFESFIKSRAKLNYPQVTNYLENNDNLFTMKYPEIARDLLIMKDLMKMLNNKRTQRGSVEFNFEESKIVLNDNGDVVKVDKYDRGVANNLIEEFMLVCNETIAETYFNKNIPFIFRTHESPREEKLETLLTFANKYGYTIKDKVEDIKSLDFQILLNDIKDKPEELPLSLMSLKTLQQARYSSTCNEHFGLAAQYYTHFTSPIRRYPDLQIHRIIKEQLNGNMNEFRKKDLEDIVKYVSKECSKKERIADNIEEEYDNLKKAEYMENNNDTHMGIITSMNDDYIEVTLPNTIIGKIRYPKKEMKFVEAEYVIKNNNNEILYELGQSLSVNVKGVNLDTTEILFNIVKL